MRSRFVARRRRLRDRHDRWSLIVKFCEATSTSIRAFTWEALEDWYYDVNRTIRELYSKESIEKYVFRGNVLLSLLPKRGAA